jgi:hypothetical protein
MMGIPDALPVTQDALETASKKMKQTLTKVLRTETVWTELRDEWLNANPNLFIGDDGRRDAAVRKIYRHEYQAYKAALAAHRLAKLEFDTLCAKAGLSAKEK